MSLLRTTTKQQVREGTVDAHSFCIEPTHSAEHTEHIYTQTINTYAILYGYITIYIVKIAYLIYHTLTTGTS